MIPDIEEASIVAGEFDFLLKISLKSTVEFELFLRKHIYNVPGVCNVKTILVIRDILLPNIMYNESVKSKK
ncbi:MAG: hypothetical protein COB24_12145 [Hyphomicrobiales bacterium]|nr:MAG: hypothetical protein COB24_12145 [Hyphomicrobiales bacterium]